MLASAVAAVSAIWLLANSQPLGADEAANVALAQRPVGDLLDLARRSGLRPLWYLYEHAWIAVFGAGDRSVHLSVAIVAIAAVPACSLAGRAVRDRRLAALAAVVASASPLLFTAGRQMGPDAQLLFVVVVGTWAFARAMRSDRAAPRLAVVACTAAGMWTHDWAVFAVGGAAVVAVATAWRGQAERRRSAAWSLAALAVGVASVLPWSTTLLHRVPGAPVVRPAAVLTTALASFHAGPEPVMFVALVLVVLGVFGRSGDDRFVVLDLRTTPDARPVAIALASALAAIAAAGLVRAVRLADAAFVVVLPLFVLLVALGLGRLRGRGRAAVAAVLLVSAGLAIVHAGMRDPSQVDDIARVVARRPDVPVVACPSSVGDGLRRLLPGRRGAVSDLGEAATTAGRRQPFYLVRDVEPTAPESCRGSRALPPGARSTLVVQPDRDDSDEPLQLELVHPAP
jgi:hypothetical protein